MRTSTLGVTIPATNFEITTANTTDRGRRSGHVATWSDSAGRQALVSVRSTPLFRFFHRPLRLVTVNYYQNLDVSLTIPGDSAPRYVYGHDDTNHRITDQHRNSVDKDRYHRTDLQRP